MTKTTAAILSTVGHPFLLAALIFSGLAIRQADLSRAWPAIASILGSLTILSLFLAFRKKRGLISNWDVSVQSERSRNIYLPTLTLVAGVASALYFTGQPFVGETLFFGLLMLVCYAINARVKISQHTVIATYLSCLVVSVQLWVGLGLLIFAVFIGWSRVVLERHQPLEVALGFGVGALFGALQWYLFA